MSRRWRFLSWLLLVLGLYAVAVMLARDVVSERPRLEAGYPWLAVAAALALALLIAVIVRALWRVQQRARAGVPGARLTRRLVARFALIALPPALVVHVFALNFLLLTVDAWFNVRLERGLESALSLGRLYVEQDLASAEAETGAIVRALAGAPDPALQPLLDDALDRARALQLAVLSPQGRVLAVASADPRLVETPLPDASILARLGNDGRYAAAEPLDDRLLLRVLQPLARGPGGNDVLQALFALPDRVATLSGEVEGARFDFERLKFLRGALKLSFALILSFVVLLSVLAALLAAVGVARRLLAPLGQLAAATRTLAGGSYDIELPAGSDDELGFLSDSFRGMTTELRAAHARMQADAAEIERQRRHLDTVLARLSTGVLGVGADGRLQTANAAAGVILDIDSDVHRGGSLAELREAEPRLAPLLDRIARELAGDRREWRDEVRLADQGGAVRILMARGTRLGAREEGMVVVFDDLTELNRAQRDAAWAEVAQRLAHEVKNPLTPIRLSAERLRHRLAGRLEPADAELLARASETIVNQVDALKALVDDFSDYARSPRLAAEPLAVDPLVREVLDLYASDPQIRVVADLAAGATRVMADPGKLRQLLHNLVRNAREAVGEAGELVLEVSTRGSADGGWFELRVADNGPGLPAGFDNSWFQPYVSTKPGGSGLGLAVVKKICDEHGGRIRARTREGGGAEFIVLLPVPEAAAARAEGPEG